MSTDQSKPAPDLEPVEFDPFAAGDLAATVPATPAQKELWTASQLGPEASCAFNESVTLWLDGPLDPGALATALQALVSRHEALRTTFSPDGELLCIAATGSLAPEPLDLSGLSATDAQTRFAELLLTEVERPFHLERGPLFRATLVAFAPDRHALVLTAHHIVCDGWSTGVLLRELGPLYTQAAGGAPAQLPEPVALTRYAAHIAAENRSRSLQWWSERFIEPAPRLDLPTDRPRPARRQFSAGRQDVVFPSRLTRALEQLGRRAQSSLFTTLLAAWAAYLARLSAETEVVIAVPAAGQATFGAEHLVSHCVSTLPIRVSVDASMGLSQLTQALRGAVLDAFDHQAVTLGELLTELALPRDPSRMPLVSVQLNLDRALDPATLGFAGLGLRLDTNPRRFEMFDLFLNLMDSPDGLRVECQYAAALFDADTIRGRLEGFEAFLEAAVAEPERPTAELPLLSAAEREQVLVTWNDTTTPLDTDATLDRLIAAQVARTPDRIALVAGDARLTYRQLDERAGRLAWHLRGLGVGPGQVVALALPRDASLLIGVLGILRAGAAYVPIDPDYPVERIAYVLERSGASTIVTVEALAQALPPSGATLVRLDTDQDQLAAHPPTPPPATAGPDDLAYIIFTSGSTGLPKGVPISHRSVVARLDAFARAPGLDADDVLVAVTTIAFDISVLELYLPLVRGARVVLAPAEVAGDGRALAQLLDSEGATLLQGTPQTYRLLLEAGWEGRTTLRAIMGGEAFGPELVEALLPRTAELWNAYGPTEATVWATVHRLTSAQAPIPMGGPMPNVRCYVLDAQLQTVPIGVPGELYLAGAGLSPGYFGEPQLTAKAFPDDPFGPGPMYRTGDVVRWLRDGTLAFERRVDTQVKLRGFRVELGEIEAVLGRHPAVVQAVAAVRQSGAGEPRLVAWYVPAPGTDLDPGELRAHLSRALPPYMVPSPLVCVTGIPTTPNGKADRKALPDPDPGAVERLSPFVSPRTDTERALAELWQEVLGLSRIGVDDDFFELGGHSLLATRLLARVAVKLGVELSLRGIFESPTLGELASRVDALQLVGGPSDGGDGPGEDREEFVF